LNARVVDTNVAIVANEKCEQAEPECVIACINALRSLVQNERVVLDDKLLIFNEYKGYFSFKGQPGVGDYFFKWVWENQANKERCEIVTITPRGSSQTDFEEFPDDPDLAGFDQSDRKFVAVALASQSSPIIFEAVDSDFWSFRIVLQRNGVRIGFLCPDQFGEGE
jgi:hypothetical protein